MRVIDLLVKIANGEEVPEYIGYRDISTHTYETMLVCKENIIYKLDQCVIDLNDEVGIIIKDKTIEEVKEIEKIRTMDIKRGYINFSTGSEMIKRINELIDAVNEIRRG